MIGQLHQRVVDRARAAGVTTGRRMRVDTTVVETNIHHPTDSALLADGIRVVTRTVQRLEGLVGRGRRAMRTRARRVTRRVLEILHAARSPKTRDALTRSYRRLVATTRAVLRDAATMQRRAAQRVRAVHAATQRRVVRAQRQLHTIVPLVQRVIAQTTQRVFHGDTHVPDKVVSLFEPHTTPIRKGKIVKPTEFGKLVTIQEADGQIVTAYAVHEGRPADATLWTPALETHEHTFGKPPQLAVADRGFASAANETAATARGVRRVILPRPGKKTRARRAHERQRWFRRGLRWRVGCEGRISVLKRRHGLHRCLYHGADGVDRWVGLGILACNLVVITTTRGAP